MQDFSRGGYDPRHSENEEQRRRYYEYVKRRQLIKRAAVVGALFLVVLVIIISVNQCDNGANMPSSLENAVVNAASDKEFPNSNIKDSGLGSEPPAAKFRICIDPGHGYDDPGTGDEASYMAGTHEKDITLAISLKIRDKLNAAGYEVIMTREDDEKPAGYENEQYLFNVIERIDWLKAQKPVDLYVSIHCDAYPDDENVCGTRLYYCNDNGDEAERFANLLAAGIQGTLGLGKTPSVNGYAYAQAYYVTKAIKLPSVLIEVGFVTNEEDVAKMKDETWQNSIAEGVLSGIDSYLIK